MSILNYLTGILIINIICVGITDCTDAMNFIKKLLIYIVTKGKAYTDNYSCKILTCSLCLTFWLSNIWLLLYCCISGNFYIWLLATPIISALFTKQMYLILLFLQYSIDTTINILNTALDKINKKLK